MKLQDRLINLRGVKITQYPLKKVNGKLIEVGEDYVVFDPENLDDIKEVISDFNGNTFWVSKKALEKVDN